MFTSRDPNPRVCGKGAARLREAGVLVDEGLLADAADPLLEAFSVSIRFHRPFIRIKWAQSLDGQLACKGGASKWITNGEARGQGHELRSRHDAVLVGAGTLRSDDPELTVRDTSVNGELGSRQPTRVILAGHEPLPGNISRVLPTASRPNACPGSSREPGRDTVQARRDPRPGSGVRAGRAAGPF